MCGEKGVEAVTVTREGLSTWASREKKKSCTIKYLLGIWPRGSDGTVKWKAVSEHFKLLNKHIFIMAAVLHIYSLNKPQSIGKARLPLIFQSPLSTSSSGNAISSSLELLQYWGRLFFGVFATQGALTEHQGWAKGCSRSFHIHPAWSSCTET